MKKIVLFLFIVASTIINGQIDVMPLNFWKTSGNAISTNTNFIGTTTNYPFTIKTNNSTVATFSNGLAVTGSLTASSSATVINSFNINSAAGTSALNLNAASGQIPSISFQEGAVQNWAIYNNPGVAGKPLVFYDAFSSDNIFQLNNGQATIRNVQSTINNYPTLNFTGVTYAAHTSLYNANHSTMPNSFGIYSNALNGFNVNDGGVKMLSIGTSGSNRTNYFLNPLRIGSAVIPTATLDVTGTGSISSNVTIGNKEANPSALGILRIGQSTSWMDLGNVDGTGSGLWFSTTTPSGTNYGIYGDASNTQLNAATTITQRIGTDTKLSINASTGYFKLPFRIGGTTAPTSLLTIDKLGVTTANSAPLKLTTTGASLVATPEAGAIEVNANGLLYYTDASGNRASINSCVYTQTAPVTVGNTTVQTSILNGTYTFPANFFNVGRTIDFKFVGFHSATGTPTINVILTLGSTTVLTTGNVQSGNSTNDYCKVEGILTCQSTGVTGSIYAQGYYQEAGGGSNTFPMTNTAATTINTTISQVLDIKVKWQTADALNTVTYSNGKIAVLR